MHARGVARRRYVSATKPPCARDLQLHRWSGGV